MTMQTDKLIAQLTETMQPVRRLRSPGYRAALWLLIVAALSAIAVPRFAPLAVFAQRMSVPRNAIECAATALTGVAAVVAAFMLSVPDRSRHWAWLPLPPFVLWLAASGLGCLQNGLGLHAGGDGGLSGLVGESAQCFRFILAAGVPLSVALFMALRRARPIAPVPVAALGTLGAAAIAAFVLQFFHTFDVTVIDLSLHLAAVGVIVLLGTTLRPLLGSR